MWLIFLMLYFSFWTLGFMSFKTDELFSVLGLFWDPLKIAHSHSFWTLVCFWADRGMLSNIAQRNYILFLPPPLHYLLGSLSTRRAHSLSLSINQVRGIEVHFVSRPTFNCFLYVYFLGLCARFESPPFRMYSLFFYFSILNMDGLYLMENHDHLLKSSYG